MQVSRAFRIQRRHDGIEPPASLLVGELMSLQGEALSIILAVFVRLTDLDKTARYRTTAIIENVAGDGDALAARRLLI